MLEQFILFNKVILNIFHNFVQNKLIICDDKDPLSRNDDIKTLIKMKKWFYQRQRRSGNIDYNMLNAITTDISNAVSSSKFRYHDRLAKRLNGPKVASKTYWSILKTFVNGYKGPLIPPLSVGNRYIADFLAKANLFNDLFSKQCSALVNNSSLPTNLTFETENRLSTFDFSSGDIIGPKKAHRHDGISIRRSSHRRCSVKKMFYCEFCEISKNTFFTEHLRTSASVSA